MPSPTSPNLGNSGSREVSDPHDTSAAAGASEAHWQPCRPADGAIFICPECDRTSPCEARAGHVRCGRCKTEFGIPQWGISDDPAPDPCLHPPPYDAGLCNWPLCGCRDPDDDNTPPPPVAGTDARETTRELSDAEFVEALHSVAEVVSAEIGQRFSQDIGRVVLWRVRDKIEAALASRRAIAPAPAGDVEQRVSDEDLAVYNRNTSLALDEHARFETKLARDLRDARTALSAMPSGRQRGLLEAAEIAEGAAWRHLGDDTYSQGMDAGARHQVDECVKSIRTAAAAQLGEPDDGWVVANGTKTLFRTWGDAGPEWTDKIEDAVRYARRKDAEKVHAEDEDAWLVLQLPLPPTPSVSR